jgi:hypothetical protein
MFFVFMLIPRPLQQQQPRSFQKEELHLTLPLFIHHLQTSMNGSSVKQIHMSGLYKASFKLVVLVFVAFC